MTVVEAVGVDMAPTGIVEPWPAMPSFVGFAGRCAAGPRATRTPRASIQAVNSSAVMRLPFCSMLKRHGVLSNSVRFW